VRLSWRNDQAENGTKTDRTQEALLQVKTASYMDDPKDATNLTVLFSRLPDGTNHVSNLVIDGVNKQFNIAIQNSNYQHV